MLSSVLRSLSSFQLLQRNIMKMSSMPHGAIKEPITPEKAPSFAMSCSGWLLPFHLGVIERLRASGHVTDSSVFAGSSGGSLAALLACSGMPTEEALTAIVAHAGNMHFKADIDGNMKRFLNELLPDDIAARCADRLHIAVTKLWPKPTLGTTVVSQFEDKEHLVQVVAASCFIPLYSGTPWQLLTQIARKAIPGDKGPQGQSAQEALDDAPVKEYYMDGGMFAVMPPLGDVRIAPVMRSDTRLLFPRRMRPHICMADGDFRRCDLVKWALWPPGEEQLRALYESGTRAADRWLAQQQSHAVQNHPHTENLHPNSQNQQTVVDKKHPLGGRVF